MNQTSLPLLVPMPRQVELASGAYSLATGRLIVLDAPRPQELYFSACRFQEALRRSLSYEWEISASGAVPLEQVALILRLLDTPASPAQGYILSVTPDGIIIEAGDEAGIFYGVCTLVQLLERSGNQLPCLTMTDWPDFPVRGVMLDISRDKVPTLDTVRALVDKLAGWKINQFQLYTEHTFAYRRHPEVWAAATPFTGQDILGLDAYCRERYIELVPNQNSFGHLRRWLVHARYQHLAEIQGWFDAPWGKEQGPFSLCPIDPASIDLLHELYDELLPHFSSRTLNVGCDETFDLGLGRSKEECTRRGAGQIYLEFLLQIYRDVSRRGYTMQYWGDIIQEHPEIIPGLPRDAIALEWGYEGDHQFDAHCARLAAAGIPFYVCPGTSSWCSISGRTENALANLKNAAENGLKHGAAGYLNTDWGDHGHWQPLSVSYLGMLAGAAYSWCYVANRDLDIQAALSWYGFGDETGIAGCMAYELGNLYQEAGVRVINTSPIFLALSWSLQTLRAHPLISEVPFQHILDRMEQVMHPFEMAKLEGCEQDLIRQEYALVARMVKHACWRGLLAVEKDPEKEKALCARLNDDMRSLQCDFEDVWLKRNRSGGLVDSLAKLKKARKDYE